MTCVTNTTEPYHTTFPACFVKINAMMILFHRPVDSLRGVFLSSSPDYLLARFIKLLELPYSASEGPAIVVTEYASPSTRYRPHAADMNQRSRSPRSVPKKWLVNWR